ncbi:hypothetical protein [Mesorhizobium sp. M0977]|uniref:hypothetical protein n=1 Tax=Mesorhizobium sp. M0977 TaxID=2957039 RepID=UPI003339A024
MNVMAALAISLLHVKKAQPLIAQTAMRRHLKPEPKHSSALGIGSRVRANQAEDQSLHGGSELMAIILT